MACYEKDCHYVMTHDGDCFYEGLPMDKKENCPMYKAKTNADRIRSMTDEEMANAIVESYGVGAICPLNHTHIFCVLDNGCKSCWFDWLREKAK